MSGIFETFKEAEAHEMKRIEKAVIRALMPFAGSSDPLLGVLALARILRTLLRKAPASAQKQLVPVLVAYMKGQTSPDSPILWTPGDPLS